MIKRLSRLFTITTRYEAFAIIYAIAVGAVGRGIHYLQIYPGWLGYFLFASCTAAVFIAGGKILDATNRKRKKGEERRTGERRAQA
jgi:hypothetical protein